MRGRFAWAWPLLIMSGIFILSQIPGKDIPPTFPMADKLVHGVLYAMLGAAVTRFFYYRGVRNIRRILCWAVFLSTLYGIFDECHQLFVPGRSFEIGDMVADCIGAGIGSCLYLRYRRYRKAYAVTSPRGPSSFR